MRGPLLVLALLATALLAGCSGGSPSDPHSAHPAGMLQEEALSAGGEEIPAAEPLRGQEDDPHGEPGREESPVEAKQNDDGTWTAWQDVALTNGVAGFHAAAVSFSTSSGSIGAEGVAAGGYRIVATVEAVGLTEQLARDELTHHHVVHADRAQEGRLVLQTYLESEPLVALPSVEPVSSGGVYVGRPGATLRIVAELPRHLAYDLAFGASSGDVRAAGLRGNGMDFGVSSGSIGLADLAACHLAAGASSGSIQMADVVACTIAASSSSGSIAISRSRAATLDVGASSGDVAVEGAFDDVGIGVSSGSIQASLTPAASGSYDFGASSGSISIDLGRGGGRAYDVTAAASSGSVQVGLEDGEDLGEDEDGNRAHVRSRGYDDARIQTTLEASASSGSISVQG